MTIFEDLDCWQSANQLKQGFPEIEHRLVNFSSLGPVPRLQCVNDKIKNIFKRLTPMPRTQYRTIGKMFMTRFEQYEMRKSDFLKNF